MAPKQPGGSKGSSKSTKAGKKSGPPSGSTSTRKSNPTTKRPPATQRKSKPGVHNQKKIKKKRVYTDKELDLPALNMITPAGVQKPRGKKKGKIFVDDKESMMTILAMVNAEKEGQIESKMIKARAMEEIREARRKEAEARQEKKQEKFEDVKRSVKRQRHAKKDASNGQAEALEDLPPKKAPRKKVAFA